jgi:ABC-type nickel/cobalt efflux system permease component RcnA
MSFTAPALLAAAASVGFGHAVLPDHWVPLSVIARAQRYPLRRVLRLSGLAGLVHVALSLVLGAILIVVGLRFRSTVEHRENLVVGGLLIATGVAFAVLELAGRGHSHDEHGGHNHGHGHDHHHHEHTHGDDQHEHQHSEEAVLVATSTPPQHEHDRGRIARLLAFAVPFGAAASPDLTILPVFLAASAAGAAVAIGTLVVFSLVTVCTIAALTVLGALAGYQLRGAWVDKGANLLTAAVLLIIGILVTTSMI